MDDKQFAAISKAISRESTRRGALARFAGGLAAALVGAKVASSDLAAKGNGKRRSKGKQRGGKKGRGAGVLRAQSAETCLTCADPSKVEETAGNNDECGFRFDVPKDPVYPINGTYEHKQGDCSCVIAWTISKTGDYSELAFEPVDGKPVCTVYQVVVKGGNAFNTYSFDKGTLCASGLVSPDNRPGEPADISHFDFCTAAVDCCKPKTCAAVGCTDGPICDGCAGTIDCPCDDENLCTIDRCDVAKGQCVYTPVVCEPQNVCETAPCACDPSDGSCDCTPRVCEPADFCEVNCRCEVPGGCICDERVCPDEPGCENLGCIDGECRYDCPEECSSCTIGYYSQNQCRVDTSVKLECAADSPIGKQCFKKYGNTLKGLLTARGGDVICAQAAAAFLNQEEFGKGSCTDGIDICNADNETLSKANEEGDCPLQGCGKPANGKPDNKKKKKR